MAEWHGCAGKLGKRSILALQACQPEAVDGPSDPPSPFDEVADALIKAVDGFPTYAAAWRNYDRIQPLMVRGDVQRAFARAIAKLPKK